MKLKYSLLGVFALIALNSCGGDSDDDNVSTPDPTSADIRGSVNLFDEGVTQIDNSGMTIRLEGSSKTATTDENGDFVLSDVPFGTYTVIYEKSGYGTFKKYDIQHAQNTSGGSTIITETPSLGQESTTSITNLTVNSSPSFPVILSSSTEPEAGSANPRYIRFFFSTDAAVSNENYDNVVETLEAQNTPSNFNLTQEALVAFGFPSGTTVYVKCYGESFYGNNYTDPDLGRDVFPNLNPTSAPAVSFVVPQENP